MIARELNVDLDLGDKFSKPKKVNQLEDGLKNFDIRLNVLHIFPAKSFEKNGKKGELCNMLVGDDTGEIRLTLWHDDVKKIEEQNIQRNSTIFLKNCFVSSFNGKKQLSLGYNGNISLEKNPMEEHITKIAELKEEMNNVDIVAKLLRAYEINLFKKEGSEGKVLNFEIADESGKIRATAWGDISEKIKKIPTESVIKIEGAYTKRGLKNLELHLGWKARIVEQPHSKIMLTEKINKKNISQIDLGETVEVNARILEILPGKLVYNSCPKCGKKLQKQIENFLCENCGEIPEPELTPVVSARIADDESEIIATFFKEQAEQLMEFDSEKLEEKLESQQAEEIIAELNKKLENKKIKMVCRLRENKFNNEKELVARNLIECAIA